MSYKDKIAQDARFFILRELTQQNDGRLNSVSLRRMLGHHGIARTPEYVETQLNALAELDAISLIPAGEVLIACIEPAGRDHVAEIVFVAGVTRPADLR